MARLLMSDEEWAVFQPFLIASTGRRPQAHRRVLDGIFWICRTGAGWRDLPEEFGKWNSVAKQFRRWAVSGVFDVMLEGFADSGGDAEMLQMIDSTVLRAHRCAAGKIKGVQNQALGRSRGGFSTKIHVRVNAEGLPTAVELTPGQAHDVTAYADLMDQRDSDPGAVLADKGYDSDAIRQDPRDRGASPEIPTKSNRTIRYSVDKALYALRARVEHCIGHLKEQRRIATRYDKTEISFVGFVLLGCLRSWFRFVHRAYGLPHLLLFSILAIVTGADSYRGICTFIKVHRESLNAGFGIAWKRAPAHTAIRYVLQKLNPADVETSFRAHAANLNGGASHKGPRALALDGKVLRGSFDAFNDRKAKQVLSAFAADTHLVLAHIEIDEKSNEIPAVQLLLQELDVAHHIVTLDALHCQKKHLRLPQTPRPMSSFS